MKPLSEVDVKQFDLMDHITPSYYKLPEDFPNPICSGRLSKEDFVACSTLNDMICSVTTGSENFKLKQKQECEELLFKNEDEMYLVDHQILQLQSVHRHLKEELVNAENWES